MTEERFWTEAPCSVTVRAGLGGYDTLLTIRGESGAEVLPKALAAIDWLDGQGARPAAAGGGNGRGDAAEICPVHKVPMRKREKQGDTWHSHKAVDDAGEEFWCRGR